MSVAGIVDDLITLQHLADQERDAARRRSLDAVRKHVAERDRGARVAEAAEVLGVSAPTVRAWIDASALRALPGSSPIRVDVGSLAATKLVIDELRSHSHNRHLLFDVLRLLRDRDALASQDAHDALADLAASRFRQLDRAGLDELLPPPRPKRSS